jgi:hypothetical protein
MCFLFYLFGGGTRSLRNVGKTMMFTISLKSPEMVCINHESTDGFQCCHIHKYNIDK